MTQLRRRKADSADRTGEQVKDSRSAGVLIAVGLVVYGAVHLLLAWITVQLAWTGSPGQHASVQGAFEELSDTSIGTVLLWVAMAGLIVLALWQVSEMIWRNRSRTGVRLWWWRARSAGRAIVYLVMGVSAAQIASGSGSKGSKQSMTATLMSDIWGRVLVVLIGVAIVAVGVALIYRGVSKGFVNDLAGSARATVLRLGQVGYPAKGLVLCLVGVLFGWAAIAYDPEKAGGLDSALRTLREQPFGPVLLTLVAAGLVAFGLYCFAWSRQPEQ